jgi:DNA recombination protein RmuC
LEEKREGAYREVLNEIKNVKETHDRLRMETTQLVQALRSPRVRGNWGELQLKKCVEFAGMVEHASFDVQVSIAAGEERLRPDCVIHLPNQRTIVIDAKTPFDAFLDAMAATDETIRAMKMAAHGERVRQHLTDLSGKAYWRQFRDSPDFVVCFLSAEVLFSAALEQDPGLIEYGTNSKVILATPTTLIALLKAVAFGWQQMDVTRNAIDIRTVGQDLYNKLAVAHEHFLNMGKAITNSVRHYNSLVGSVEGRGSVFSLARNMGAMGVGQIEIAELPPIELATRDLKADDWIPGLLSGSQENED